jgi:peroxiredoxin Q/BCP
MANKVVSDFALPSTGGKEFRLSAVKSKLLVLYFYPKDNTPGCTTEGMQFRDLHPQFQNFKAKMKFPFELLSDEDEKICGLFGVMKMKNMYGKQVRGIERSTFVLDKNRVIQREWRGVKVPGHVQEVLEFVKTL